MCTYTVDMRTVFQGMVLMTDRNCNNIGPVLKKKLPNKDRLDGKFDSLEYYEKYENKNT